MKGVGKWKRKDGGSVWVVSKTWPDGSRTRKRVASEALGKKLMIRIEESIITGSWRDFREEIMGGVEDPTFSEFSETYLEEYCKRNRRPDFKVVTVNVLKPILGSVKIRSLTRAHAYEVIQKSDVAPATINRRLAVLSSILNFAVDKGLIDRSPMMGFKRLPEEEKALRLLTLEQTRHLVECVASVEPTIGAYTAILGETGLRKSEGLRLEWTDIDLGRRLLTVARSKSGRVRHVPLSEYALDWLRSLDRVLGVEPVFLKIDGNPWKDPRGPFLKGREIAGLDWVGFHDLRHFRASQWIMGGVDVRSVQELLGHRSISTTLRYAHLAPNHARDAAEAAMAAESKKWQESGREAEEAS